MDRSRYALKSAARWFRRMFFGGGKELSALSGERIESPTRLLIKEFFSKKTAVVACVLLAGLFLFVFIAPLFIPLDINYTDPLQQNVAPGYDLRDVPKSLKKSVADVNGFADFTVGVSKEGKFFIWGNTKDRLHKTDLKKVPKAVKAEGVLGAAAGKDHIIAVTKTGKIVGWGDNSCGQYGSEEKLGALPMPAELAEGIDPANFSSIVCGYQVSALVLKDGKAYFWGNTNAVRNLEKVAFSKEVQAVAFTNSAAIVLKKDGGISTGDEEIFLSAISSKNGYQNNLASYLLGRKVEKIAADNKSVALLLEGNELVVSGAFENGEDELPRLKSGERLVDLAGGTRHFIGVTDKGRVYAWGHNAYGQCDVEKVKSSARVFAGAMQSYAVDGRGKLVKSLGLKGYLMGTDGRGRDVFARIVHGGKMTLTIGAVAVVISSLIAVVVGCLAGYFGGFIDTLLMRITEIFSSLPFLPFAMLLSQIIKNYNVSETMRIFIIMLILGALSWTGLARMIRGQILSEREKEFVLAARAIGVKESKIAFRHVLPNVVSVILVSMTLDFAGCLLTESSLSYLGFGVQQPKPTWGNMLSGSNSSIVIQRYWWQWLFPALFLSLAVICINVIGDALRDAFDPKKEE